LHASRELCETCVTQHLSAGAVVCLRPGGKVSRKVVQERICANCPIGGALVRECLFRETKGMSGLGDNGAVASLDVSHVDEPGPLIPPNSAPGDG
jgi:hypothetical protein